MGDWKQWSDWLKEGYYVNYYMDGTIYYEHIIARDLAHYEYAWHETVKAGETSGPKVPELLVVTKGYDAGSNTNRIWQTIFGIKGQVLIYIELPADTHRHGLPKAAKPSSELREVSHFEEWMSPFYEPTFLTEHFMMKDGYERINLEAYNPNEIDITNLRLNIFIAKLVTERIGTVKAGVQTPMSARWKELLDRLYRGIVTCRPLTLAPVRAPAAE